MERFFAENGFSTLELLPQQLPPVRRAGAVRDPGWFYEEDRAGARREDLQPGADPPGGVALKAAGEREKYCFLHYPPSIRATAVRRSSSCWSAIRSAAAFTAISTAGATAWPSPDGRAGWNMTWFPRTIWASGPKILD